MKYLFKNIALGIFAIVGSLNLHNMPHTTLGRIATIIIAFVFGGIIGTLAAKAALWEEFGA